MARFNRYVFEEDGEEEEDPQLTKVVVDFLKLRNRLKEEKRKTWKKELGTGSSREEEKNLSSIKPKDNYGNFFGPSQTVIAQRVIEESKLLTENPDLAAGVMKSIQIAKKSSMSGASVGSKPQANVEKPKVAINMLQRKVQILKYSRDYSFLLSDDTNVPEPFKDPPTPIVFPPKSEIATSIESSKETLSNKGGNKVFIGEEDKKPLAATTSRIRPTIANERSAESIRKHSQTPPVVTSSIQTPAPVKKQMLLPPPPKPKAIISQSNFQPPPTYRQEKKRRRHNNNNNNNDDIDKDFDDPINEIRKMFGYNPRKYADDDEDDNMEANFEDILKEERRSAKIGRKEDEEEFRKIEKERKERLRKKAKKTENFICCSVQGVI